LLEKWRRRTPPRYAAFIPSRRHQLPLIAPLQGARDSILRIKHVVVSLTSVAWAASTYQAYALDVVAPPGAIVTFETITNGDTFASGEAVAIRQ